MHGGKVEVSSALGQGSEFVVSLPIMQTPTRSPSPATVTTEPSGASLRVLVVDDRRDAVELLATLLKTAGHEVRTAADGPTALEAALDYRPDVVVLDIGLPGLNGFEVAKRIRKEPTVKHAVLIAMTGYGQPADRQCSKEAGFDHHLVKPADFGEVLRILATVGEKTA
jgi:CheY-like chemotaxis protein